jgi:hypothetical protein
MSWKCLSGNSQNYKDIRDMEAIEIEDSELLVGIEIRAL